MFPNIDAAMIYVQFVWMTTSRRICVEREEIANVAVFEVATWVKSMHMTKS